MENVPTVETILSGLTDRFAIEKRGELVVVFNKPAHTFLRFTFDV